jgi:hypothetical protein
MQEVYLIVKKQLRCIKTHNMANLRNFLSYKKAVLGIYIKPYILLEALISHLYFKETAGFRAISLKYKCTL